MSDNSDQDETDSEGEEAGPHETEFRCKKCPGRTFKDTERQQHREFHSNVRRSSRNEKKNDKKKSNRPGPKSKKKSVPNRAGSPVPSATGTLFSAVPVRKTTAASKSAQQKSPAKRRKAAEVVEPDPDDISIEARLARAKVQHYKNAKGMKRKFNGA